MDTQQFLKDAFLTIQYRDHRRAFETWRVYNIDGSVHIFDGQHWRIDYTLTSDDIEHIKQVLADCGLLTAASIMKTEVYDSATLVWMWQWNTAQGQLSNRAYPAIEHPAMNCAMNYLLELENHYRSEDPLAE